MLSGTFAWTICTYLHTCLVHNHLYILTFHIGLTVHYILKCPVKKKELLRVLMCMCGRVRIITNLYDHPCSCRSPSDQISVLFLQAFIWPGIRIVRASRGIKFISRSEFVHFVRFAVDWLMGVGIRLSLGVNLLDPEMLWRFQMERINARCQPSKPWNAWQSNPGTCRVFQVLDSENRE